MKKTTFDSFCQAVKSNFNGSDEFFPYFYTETKDGRVLMIPASASSHESKDEMLFRAKLILAYVEADFYYSVNDTYMVVKDNENDLPEGSIKDEPGRVEALVITGVTEDMTLAKCFGYERDEDNNIIWTEVHAMSEDGAVAGRYIELLEHNKAIKKSMPQAAEKLMKSIVEQCTIT